MLDPPQLSGLYGNAIWDVCRPGHVCRPGRSARDFASAFAVGRVGAQEPGRLAGRVASRNTKPKITAQWHRDANQVMRPANISAREIKTDFTFLIGVTNLFAFEAMVFIALLLLWYVVKPLERWNCRVQSNAPNGHRLVTAC